MRFTVPSTWGVSYFNVPYSEDYVSLNIILGIGYMGDVEWQAQVSGVGMELTGHETNCSLHRRVS